jgi:hypothetical protein
MRFTPRSRPPSAKFGPPFRRRPGGVQTSWTLKLLSSTPTPSGTPSPLSSIASSGLIHGALVREPAHRVVVDRGRSAQSLQLGAVRNGEVAAAVLVEALFGEPPDREVPHVVDHQRIRAVGSAGTK